MEVESPQSADLSKILSEIREQYEDLMERNKTEAEKWFLEKVSVSFVFYRKYCAVKFNSVKRKIYKLTLSLSSSENTGWLAVMPWI